VNVDDAWQLDATPGTVPRPDQLRLLVADAAGRAAMMLAGSGAAGEVDDPLVDAVRILATAEGASHAAQAARLTGRQRNARRSRSSVSDSTLPSSPEQAPRRPDHAAWPAHMRCLTALAQVSAG